MRGQCEAIDVKCLALVSSISAWYEVHCGSPRCQCQVPRCVGGDPAAGCLCPVPVLGADVKCPV